jgi:hemerythrin-like domain-containing protein
MSNITGQLSEEHQTILRAIDAILAECTLIEKGKSFDPAYFEMAIDFIKNYADKFHHSKEEDVLFKAMMDNMDQMHCNPIPVMLHDHDDGREHVKEMEEGLRQNDHGRAIANAKGYCYLLKDHIYKEDNILYPMAEEALDEASKQLVLKQYDTIEKEQFDEAAIQKYLNMFK